MLSPSEGQTMGEAAKALPAENIFQDYSYIYDDNGGSNDNYSYYYYEGIVLNSTLKAFSENGTLDAPDIRLGEAKSVVSVDADLRQAASNIDRKHLKAIYKFLLDVNFTGPSRSTEGSSGIGVGGAGRDHLDLSKPHLRTIFRPVYPLVIIVLFYAVLVVLGLGGNLMVSLVVWKRRLFRTSNTQACILNMAVAFLIQLLLVIPLSVFVLVVQNWVLGSFVCYFLPMCQVRKSGTSPDFLKKMCVVQVNPDIFYSRHLKFFLNIQIAKTTAAAQ